jgi:hypothetical protein
MTTEIAMTTWVVTYNDYASSVGGVPVAARVEVDAAYYAPADHLIEFKDSDHQVVFALHAGIISTIRRGDVKLKPSE